MSGNHSDNGSKLEKKRRELGLSQRALAKMIGCGVMSISGWENGKHIPNRSTLEKIGNALGCDWKELID